MITLAVLPIIMSDFTPMTGLHYSQVQNIRHKIFINKDTDHIFNCLERNPLEKQVCTAWVIMRNKIVINRICAISHVLGLYLFVNGICLHTTQVPHFQNQTNSSAAATSTWTVLLSKKCMNWMFTTGDKQGADKTGKQFEVNMTEAQKSRND